MYCPVGYHGVDRQSTSESPCENAELHCFFRIDALLTPDKSAHGSASDQDLPAAWVVGIFAAPPSSPNMPPWRPLPFAVISFLYNHLTFGVHCQPITHCRCFGPTITPMACRFVCRLRLRSVTVALPGSIIAILNSNAPSPTAVLWPFVIDTPYMYFCRPPNYKYVRSDEA